MKLTRNVFGCAVLAGICALTLASCGEDDNGNGGGPPLTETLGGFELDCGEGQTQQQQKNVPFQQQQSCVQKKQSSGKTVQQYSFPDSKVEDFKVRLDCGSRTVAVMSTGKDEALGFLPIQDDGTVNGNIQYQDQISNDGKGNVNCWVGYIITFKGKATCEGIATTSAAAAPAALAQTGTAEGLSLTVTVAFEQSSEAALLAAGISLDEAAQAPETAGGPSPSPSPSPSASPSPTAAATPNPTATVPLPTPAPTLTFAPVPDPSASASPSPTVSPSPSPTATTSPSPTATPSPSVTPVKFCIVDDACPVEGTADLSCEQQ